MNGKYRHYKGGIYYVIGEGRHSEHKENLVLYIDEKQNLWARPTEMFKGTLEVDGKEATRFELINPELIALSTFRKDTYKHYKGGTYHVIGEGKHTETEEDLVFYHDDLGNLWVRPTEMFNGTLEVDGKEIVRFERINC